MFLFNPSVIRCVVLLFFTTNHLFGEKQATIYTISNNNITKEKYGSKKKSYADPDPTSSKALSFVLEQIRSLETAITDLARKIYDIEHRLNLQDKDIANLKKISDAQLTDITYLRKTLDGIKQNIESFNKPKTSAKSVHTPHTAAKEEQTPNSTVKSIRDIETAKSFIRASNLTKAITTLTKFIKSNKNDRYLPNALFYRGYCYFKTRDFSNAINDFIEAYSLNTSVKTTPHTLYYLYKSLIMANMKSDAEKILNKLKSDFPNYSYDTKPL